jgi:hypothetical protein
MHSARHDQGTDFLVLLRRAESRPMTGSSHPGESSPLSLVIVIVVAI